MKLTRPVRRCAWCGAVAALGTLLAPAASAADKPVYKDPEARVEARVDDLLRRMTLEEKVAQLVTLWNTKQEVLDGLRFEPARASAAYPHGIGQVARPSDRKGTASVDDGPGGGTGDRWRTIEDTVNLVNAMQRWAIEDTRLGIPVLFHEESLHGYMATPATMFPQAIGLASSFDPPLLREINEVIAREVRVRGVPLVLSPVVDVVRDPRWGRVEETFGEDPYLAAELGVAAVQGLQGEGARLGPESVFATLKHLTGHGQPESGINVGPAPIAERTLREFFLPPFEEIVRRTQIAAVMPSYNEIDGVPSHANRWLLQEVLRGEWGFKGAILSDYSGIDELATLHAVEPDLTAAAIRALEAGVDSDLPDGLSFRKLTEAVRAGRLSEATLDVAVRRMLTLKFLAGLFEHPYGDAARAETLTGNAEARALALKAAQKSVVLLKNDGVLPLDRRVARTIAVIGPNADVARLGGYSAFPRQAVSLRKGIEAAAGSALRVTYAQGVFITQSEDRSVDEVLLADPERNRRLIAEAVEVARQADLVVLAIGDTEQTTREGYSRKHLGDRSSLELVGEQDELASALFALGKPVVVVLINGRPLSVVNVAARANALVEAWYPGQEGGTALAAVLFGEVNPGGKLPVTFPRSVGQLPMFYNAKPSARRGYLFDTTEPLFPFGFGLSYTRFDIGAPRLSQQRIGRTGTVGVEVDVRNVGGRAGDEVVQVYVRDKISSVTRPVKELKAFQRVTLAPGAQRTLQFTLDQRAFWMWNQRMERVVEPGEFEILVGSSSVDLKSAVLVIGD